MKIALRATLVAAISDWVENECEHEDRPDGYIHTQLAEEMARAAEAVYDATFSIQLWLRKEGE